jgi:hypothetical protein
MGNADNSAKGAHFEALVRAYFQGQGLDLHPSHAVLVGASSDPRPHRFDLGSDTPPVLVECKSHTWTGGGNAPSAKLSVWNEAMFYFMVAPPQYRKILVVLDDRRGLKSLAQHYVKRFAHLVPTGVEIWELASDGCDGRLVHKGA